MKKILFNDGFEFKMAPFEASLLNIGYGMNSSGYVPVEIPHDATIHDAHNFYTDYVIWYRKQISYLPAKDNRLMIYFEGVYMEAAVYINDQCIGRNVNGFNSFCFDITEYVTSKEDMLYVSIDFRNPNARWYTGPGINRNVWLLDANETHISPDSVYVCPTLTKEDNWELYAAATPVGKYDKLVYICEELGIHAESDSAEFITSVSSPGLWNPNSPNMYDFRVELYNEGRLTDSETVRFGFRHIEFDPNKGMFLNGKHVKLHGVCLHADAGCLGTAFYKDAARRQLQLMKDMGVNAIRGSHNIQAPEFLDLCDEMGLMLLNESFDSWKREKTTYDYARFFEEWAEKDLTNWVRRDRNHPCIIMWSAGNEIYDTHAGIEGKETLEFIRDVIERTDYRGHARVTLCSNYMAWENTINAVESIKLAGYNYGEHLYKDHHQAHPDWVIFGSETASCVQSRGIYHFPLSKSLLVDDDEQCSSLGNCCTSWGATNLDFCLATERDTEFSLGQFYWSGTDYLGEPTPYHTKSSYFGMADTAGFPKDVYYLNQSLWTSVESNPMIHILPYWDFNDGQLIDVRVCSNAPEVELFFNGSSLGRQAIDHEHGFSFYADYRIPYAQGELKAVGIDASGNIIAQTTEYSFGDTAVLSLTESTSDDHALTDYSFDVEEGDMHLRFIEIEALDSDSHPVRNASDRVNFRIDGPAKLIGLDNGNSTDYESFKGSSKRLFSGKLLAVVKPDGTGGRVTVRTGIDSEKVYVRKLEISTDACNPLKITPDEAIINVELKVYPANATCKAIEYQITNESGVPIQHAVIDSISEDGLHATVRVQADAEFRIRALCREDDDRVTCISQLEFASSGFGTLHSNPYDFVVASLYSESVGELGNGNEKGIATSRLEDNYILYKNLEFGKTGSDTVTLPIFELENTPLDIIFWRGMPHAEGSHIIGSGVYHKKSIWNVYQEETYKLNETLTGLVDFGIEVHSRKIHIKGFVFTEKNKAYETNRAVDIDEIYGDDYKVENESVNGIGNNVSMVFKDMDFGPEGAGRITVCGHTPLDQNTIHIRFTDGQTEQRRAVEFKHSDGFEEQSFEIEPLTGKGDIVFIFLPGCNFDFKWFKFE